MKKRERKKLKDNIILFPDLDKRLLDKGLECLKQKKFTEAIKFFEEAISIDPENGDIHFGLVLAYFESGLLQKAKALSNHMLQAGIGDYIQVIDLYLMILVQLHQYDEIVTTIEVLLEEREIPKERFEHFNQMLQFSRRMAESKPEEALEQEVQSESKYKELNLFSYQNQNEQMLIIAKLADQNIRPYIDEIKTYLQSKEGQPFLKTMLLNVLKEHDYEKEIIIEKLDMEKLVRPSELPDVDQQPQLKKILLQLSDHLEHENPVLYENTKSLIEQQFFLLYPFTLEPEDASVWAAAYHSLANQYLGMPDSSDSVALFYNVNEEDILKAEKRIKKIEEISYPNI